MLDKGGARKGGQTVVSFQGESYEKKKNEAMYVNRCFAGNQYCH